MPIATRPSRRRRPPWGEQAALWDQRCAAACHAHPARSQALRVRPRCDRAGRVLSNQPVPRLIELDPRDILARHLQHFLGSPPNRRTRTLSRARRAALALWSSQAARAHHSARSWHQRCRPPYVVDHPSDATRCTPHPACPGVPIRHTRHPLSTELVRRASARPYKTMPFASGRPHASARPGKTRAEGRARPATTT